MNSSDLKAKFDTEWGGFRKFIASNPLTGFWLGVAFGAFAGGVAKIALHGFGLV